MSQTTSAIIVTGGNAGLGFQTALTLARGGRPVVLACRSRTRGEEAAGRIREEVPSAAVDVVACDLEDFASVRSAADELSRVCPRPSALINNAGVYRARMERTTAGFERTLATNHLGHFLLTHLLEPTLRATGTRVIQVTSKAHENGRLDRRPLTEIFAGPDDYRGFGAYADSKLANVLFTRELQQRWRGDVTALAVHPGLLASSIWDRNRTVAMWFVRRLKRFMRDPAEAGVDVATVATEAEWSARGGSYVNRTVPTDPTLPADSDRLAAELWDRSAEAVGLSTGS
jgi:NAD(P)-dependent dehydrogenase (short-subunit alcohol dehydrogenase family)